MTKTNFYFIFSLAILAFVGSACANPNTQPIAPTPIPSLAPAATLTLVPDIQPTLAPASDLEGLPEGQAAIGAALYEANCSVCHGQQGQGIDGPPLRNSKVVQNSTPSELFAIIAEGRAGTGMPAWLQQNGGSLMAGNVNNIMAYLQTIQHVSKIDRITMEEDKGEQSATQAAGQEPARPSEPGDPGAAVSLAGDASQGRAVFGAFCAACHGPQGRPEVGLPNPGSDDGVVPPLNPIDPSLIDANLAVYRTNLDLFIEHGSVPEGDNPRIMMPPFGDQGLLTDQQIADVIAYLIYLNGDSEAP